MRIAYDVGGVLSKYPEVFRPLVNMLHRSDPEDGEEQVSVHIISDMHPVSKILDWLQKNKIHVWPQHVHSADYATHGEMCKAVLCNDLGIDLLIDDFPGYVGTPGKPAVRLLVMPDPERPYYADEWVTDGSEGDFGRRRKCQ